MKHAIIFDCEFLTKEGSQSRFWCGPQDPDPVVAQIGMAKLSLEDNFEIIDSRRLYVVPKDRRGSQSELDPFFTQLTGISEEDLQRQGTSLEQALDAVSQFADGARLWSWGKDEFHMIAISCYVEGIQPPIPVTRFSNACSLLLKAGMPQEDLNRTRSHLLADYYKVDHPPLRGHDAQDDALSVAFVLQHLLRQKLLAATHFC